MSEEPIFAFRLPSEPCRFTWTPQEDITAHELAQLMPMLLMAASNATFTKDMLPDDPKLLRHIKIIE